MAWAATVRLASITVTSPHKTPASQKKPPSGGFFCYITSEITLGHNMRQCTLCNTEKPDEAFDTYKQGMFRLYCKDCRRAKDRATAEKRRREKGIEPVKGTQIPCQNCGVQFTRFSVRTTRCADCQREEVLSRAREASLAKARARGNRVMGSDCTCENCGVVFALDQKNAKYCKDCRGLQKKGALPFMKEHSKKYRAAYKESVEKRKKMAATASEYRKQRRKTDPVFVMSERVRARIKSALRYGGYTKRSSTAHILGCSFEFLKGWLESQFLPGMTWENRDKWHIDHKTPLASAKTEEDIIRLNHYTNLQPLWAGDNQRKGAKMEHTQ